MSRRKAQSLQLVVGRVVEDGVERAAGDRLALLDELQRALHALERQVEARCGIVGAAGVERDDPPADVDHRRPGRAAGSARGRLQVEGIEVVVLAEAVLRRLPIEPGERAGEDGELLAGIVADDADFPADRGALGIELQRLRLDVVQLASGRSDRSRSRAPDRDRWDRAAPPRDRGIPPRRSPVPGSRHDGWSG